MGIIGPFLDNENESYLLYWWYCLDGEGSVGITICIQDKFQCVHTKGYIQVSIICENNFISRKGNDTGIILLRILLYLEKESKRWDTVVYCVRHQHGKITITNLMII